MNFLSKLVTHWGIVPPNVQPFHKRSTSQIHQRMQKSLMEWIPFEVGWHYGPFLWKRTPFSCPCPLTCLCRQERLATAKKLHHQLHQELKPLRDSIHVLHGGWRIGAGRPSRQRRLPPSLHHSLEDLQPGSRSPRCCHQPHSSPKRCHSPGPWCPHRRRLRSRHSPGRSRPPWTPHPPSHRLPQQHRHVVGEAIGGAAWQLAHWLPI